MIGWCEGTIHSFFEKVKGKIYGWGANGGRASKTKSEMSEIQKIFRDHRYCLKELIRKVTQVNDGDVIGTLMEIEEELRSSAVRETFRNITRILIDSAIPFDQQSVRVYLYYLCSKSIVIDQQVSNSLVRLLDRSRYDFSMTKVYTNLQRKLLLIEECTPYVQYTGIASREKERNQQVFISRFQLIQSLVVTALVSSFYCLLYFFEVESLKERQGLVKGLATLNALNNDFCQEVEDSRFQIYDIDYSRQLKGDSFNLLVDATGYLNECFTRGTFEEKRTAFQKTVELIDEISGCLGEHSLIIEPDLIEIKKCLSDPLWKFSKTDHVVRSNLSNVKRTRTKLNTIIEAPVRFENSVLVSSERNSNIDGNNSISIFLNDAEPPCK